MGRRLPLPETKGDRDAVARDAVRGAAVELRLDGRPVRGFEGESLAAALAAGGEPVLSRSLKYHRPRSHFCLDGHCGGCLMRIDGVPNQRACMTPCRDGAVAESQNAFPSANLDVLEAVDWMFSDGLNHHTLMTGSALMNRVANKVVRQLSGLGTLPEVDSHRPAEIPPARALRCEVCVIGGGPAGLAAALTAARLGAEVMLLDEQPRVGGSLRFAPRIDSPSGPAQAEALLSDALAAGVQVHTTTTAIAYYPNELGGVLVASTPTGLLLIQAERYLYATGGYAQNLLFGNNDRPGVMAARAVGRLLVDHGIVLADKLCVVGADAYAIDLTTALRAVGVEVTHVDQRQLIAHRVRGRQWVRALEAVSKTGKRHKFDCELVAVSSPPSPAIEGLRQHGCDVELRPEFGGHVALVDDQGATNISGVYAVGDVCGYVGTDAAEQAGRRVGAAVAASLAAPTSARGSAPGDADERRR